MSKILKKLKSGVTVYYVHSLGDRSYSAKYELTSKPYVFHGSFVFKGLFVNAFCYDWKCRSEFSLLDANVIKNKYNTHKLFTSRAKADSYLKMCLDGIIN